MTALAVAAYAGLTVATALQHEPWADEAQSWLLARDAGIIELWTRLLHYEGTTGLWQTLLHLLISAGLPYSGLNVLSAVLSVAAAAIVFWHSPFPPGIRLALPFTFFLAYQYAVVARSYDLLPLLLFACAAVYPVREKHPAGFTALLILIAAVSVHGMLLAAAIGATSMRGIPGAKRVWPALIFALAIGLLAAAAWPAPDGVFVTGPNLSVEHFGDVARRAFAAAFTGEWISSLAVVGLSLPALWRGGSLALFGLASLLLCAIDAIVYAQVWHFGMLFLMWIFSLWIAQYRMRSQDRVPVRLAWVALALVTAIQCFWTARSVGYDWVHAYSGSRAAAHVLQEIAGHRIFAIGYACVAIEPYFGQNIFANVNEGRRAAYWDWSRKNHVNEDSLRLAALRPDYVVVGYKNAFERDVWRAAIRKNGYREIRHFEGNTFWQAQVFEPESYDLFAPGELR